MLEVNKFHTAKLNMKIRTILIRERIIIDKETQQLV